MHALHRLFAARSIAVIGASTQPARIGGRPISFLKQAGYTGAIYPINPRHDEIQGLASYPSIQQVPGPVDVAIVAVPASQAVEVLRACGEHGVGFAVMFTAGFAEVGQDGHARQEQIVEVARSTGVRILGPNSIGYASAGAQIVASFGSCWVRDGSLPLGDGSVSFVSQSGAFGVFISAMAQDSGVAFRHFVNLGNEVDIDFAEALEYIIEDPAVKAVGGYIEGIRDGARFAEVAHRANELGKPLVMIKVGRSQRSQEAAASHTASLTGADAVYQAIFDECNVIRVDDVQHMLDILALCEHDIVADDPGVATLSVSGGAGVWAVDQLERLGMRVADFSSDTRQRLDELLPAFGSSRNPVDSTAQLVNEPEMLQGVLEAINADPDVGLTLLLMGLQEQTGERLAKDVIAVAADSDTPVVVAWIAGPRALYDEFAASPVPVFPDFSRALAAVGSLAGYARRRRRMGEEPDAVLGRLLQPSPHQTVSAGVGGREDHQSDAGSRNDIARAGGAADAGVERAEALAEHDAKQRLGRLGLSVPALRVVASADAAAAAADDLGYPVVIKAAAAGRILHKTDLGLLHAGLESPDAVREAFSRVAAAAAGVVGDDAEVFVERQAGPGVEMIVTLLRDDVFGPYILLGLGGELVELIGEVGLHRAPLTSAEVVGLLEDHPRIMDLLRGVRGAGSADVPALIDLVVKISRLPSQPNGDRIVQVECNPVRVHVAGRGASILDAVWIER